MSDFDIKPYLENEELILDLRSNVDKPYICNKYNLGINLVKRLRAEFKYDENQIKQDIFKYYEDKTLTFNDIGEKLNLTSKKVQTLFDKFGLDNKGRNFSKEAINKKINRINRNAEVKLMLNNGLTYIEISEKVNIPISVAQYVGKKIGIRKQYEKKQEYLNLIEKITNDIVNNNYYFSDLVEKYHLNYKKIINLQNHGLMRLVVFYKNKRDEIIKKLYSEGKSALEILDMEFNQKSWTCKLSSMHQIYYIVDTGKAIDAKKPNSFYNPLILDFIDLLLKSKTKHDDIVKYLNEKNFKTRMGKKFTVNNLTFYITELNNKKNEKIL